MGNYDGGLKFEALSRYGVITVLNNLHTMPWVWLLAKATDDSRIKQLLDFLNNNPMIGWGIAGFAVLAMATAAIAKWTGNLDKIIVFVQKYLSQKKPEITEAQRLKARQDLIEILLKQVVKRLEDSLHHKIRIDLRREEQLQRVGQGNLESVQEKEISENFLKRTFKQLKSSTPTEPVHPNKSTQELFEQKEIQGRLLILGEPGSGKTNELLVLARNLLSLARKSPDKPIPVIFELSEWKAEQEFADWLSQQLFDKYNVPIVISKHWIIHEQMLPLLDGLDELRRVDEVDSVTAEELDKLRIAKQIQCVQDINSFLDIFPLPLVVCCRRKEYEALEAESQYLKRLNGAIYLQALEDEQIREYLQRLNRSSLWEAVRNQPDLLELAHSPLFLLILMVAYQGQNIHSKEELLDEYIHKQLHDLNNQGAYPPGKAPGPEETHHYLIWLASRLYIEGKNEFLIEELQPSWLNTSKARKQYRRIFGLMVGLIFGLISGLTIGLIEGLTFDLKDKLNQWLFRALSRELGGGLSRGLSVGLSDITTSEKLSFSSINFFRSGLVGGLIGALMFGMLFGLLDMLISGLNEVFSGIQTGAIVGGLVGASFGALICGIESSKIDVSIKITPNEGIRDSINNGLIIGLIGVLVIGLLLGLLLGLNRGLVETLHGIAIGIYLGLFLGLMGGLDAVLRHLSLRIVLYKSGVSPWNYAKFLEHAENHRFIQRTGGRYRFVHDLLRKRFAATLEES